MAQNLISLTDVSASAASGAPSGDACCGGGCCGGGGHAGAASEGSLATVSAEYLVSGLTCGHCVSSVTEELGELPGVTGVSVELNAGGDSRVTVSSTLPLHPDEVASAVSDAGYSIAR